MSQFINDEIVSHDINHELDRQNTRNGRCATPAMFREGEQPWNTAAETRRYQRPEMMIVVEWIWQSQ